MDILRRRALLFFSMMGCLILFGTLGFIIVERYHWFDALYMTVITLTTVGYYEVKALSAAGRVFNMVLLLVGVNAILFGVGMMTSTIIELQLDHYFDRKRRQRMIDSLHDHYIICGFGRVGRGAAHELMHAKVPVVVIDNSEDRIDMVIKAGMLGVLADSTRDETLRGVRIDRARGLVAALASDADNLFLTLSAKTLNPKLTVATRANEEESAAKLRRAGADSVVSPYGVTGSRLAQSLIRPHVTQFLDYAMLDPSVDLGIEQFRIDPGSGFSTSAVRDLKGMRKEYGVTVLAIRRGDGEMVFNPDPDSPIHTGDHLIVMGKASSQQQLERLLVISKS
ncbi:MAG: NAD-binding protein [Acidobacteria bacterium]|nr:NAD-binding protein [Acidobacteriota bacterium]